MSCISEQQRSWPALLCLQSYNLWRGISEKFSIIIICTGHHINLTRITETHVVLSFAAERNCLELIRSFVPHSK